MKEVNFPIIMNYLETGNGQPYFYFLNGHNDVVFFSNSTFDDYESYEYNPWGILLTSASKNNLLYTAREFDFDTGLQYKFKYYFPLLARYNSPRIGILKNKFIFSKNNPTNQRSSTGGSSDGFWDCVYGCYDQRGEWEVECYDNYIICINNCYDFEPPDIPLPEGVQVVGAPKCAIKFPKTCDNRDPKEEECNCWEEYQNCLYAEIPGKLADCMEECGKK